ncbi:N-acetyltransferase, partial [bacterium]
MSNAPVPSLPQTVQIDSQEFTLRTMSGADREAVLEFARSLSEHDLLFLRRDITRVEVVDEWLREIDAGEATTIVADSGGAIGGYATVYRSALPWTAHVGELRVVTSPGLRGMGLGRILTGHAFDLALAQ